MRASEPAANAASATNVSRYREHPLAGALAFRRSVAVFFSFGPRFTHVAASFSAAAYAVERAPRGPVQNAGRAGSETARVRSAKPRAGTAARSTNRYATG